MEKDGEESKDGEDVELRDSHYLWWVEVVPMPEFVRWLI